MSLEESTRDEIATTIENNSVVVFMKGNRTQPQCGFSATVVQILDQMATEYETVDVLANPGIREGIKTFSNWPTIPQLYIDGEFIGGCDIIKDMNTSGDLQKKLKFDITTLKAPSLTITDTAAEALKSTLTENDAQVLHLSINAQFQISLELGEPTAAKLVTSSNGIGLYIDIPTIKRAEGMTIDFVDGPQGSGFKIDNPNSPPAVQQMPVSKLKELMDSDTKFKLIDVRTPDERATACIDGSLLLTQEVAQELARVDKETILVFHCHHGGRSQQAAEQFRDSGFRNVHNVVGGIDTWSQEIDSAVPRY
jgi:monothiol glutaredoxin